MKYRSRLGYRLDRALSGGLGHQLIIYLFAVLLIFLILWTIALLIHIPIKSEKTDGFSDFWTMLFFFYDGGLEGTLPNNRWYVYLVNLIGSIVMGGILVATITNFLQNHTSKAEDGLLRYKMKGHSVFIGADDCMLPLLRSCLENNRDVIVISENSASKTRMLLAPFIFRARKGRIVVYHGERTDKKELESLCIGGAEEVVILPDSSFPDTDAVNLDVVKKISEICDAEGRKGLKCSVVFKDDSTVACFERGDLNSHIKQNLVFTPIIYADSIARALLSGKAYNNGFLDRETIGEDSEKQVELFVIGLGDIGRAVFCQAARQLHFPNFERTKSRITLIGEDGEIIYLKARFREFFDAIDKEESRCYIDVSIRSISLSDKHAIDSALDSAILVPESVVTVAICTEDSSLALKQLLSLPRSVFEKKIPVWFYKPGSRSLTELMGENQYYSNIKVFGESDPVFSLDGSELVAQRINWVYSTFSETGQVPEGLPPTDEWKEKWIPAWNGLSLNKKWSNLHNADSIPVKMRSLGVDTSGDVHLTERQIQLLTEVEHNRWVVETLLAGYRPPTQEERKDIVENRKLKNIFKEKLVHVDLCAFNNLLPDANNMDVRDYDRVIVESIHLLLK